MRGLHQNNLAGRYMYNQAIQEEKHFALNPLQKHTKRRTSTRCCKNTQMKTSSKCGPNLVEICSVSSEWRAAIRQSAPTKYHIPDIRPSTSLDDWNHFRPIYSPLSSRACVLQANQYIFWGCIPQYRWGLYSPNGTYPPKWPLFLRSNPNLPGSPGTDICHTTSSKRAL